jgi:hypothetical protein
MHIVLGYGSCDAVQVSRGHSQDLQPGLQGLDVAGGRFGSPRRFYSSHQGGT